MNEAPTPAASDDPWHGCNPLDPVFRADPHPRLARLRESHPVDRTPVGIWRLLRYADCVRLLREVRCGARTTDGRIPGVDESGLVEQREFMLQQDPPAHTRLRKLVSRAFTPRAVERMRPRVQAIVDELLDRVAPGGEMDVIADLALPVPATTICEMLGVPVEDRDRFTAWTAQATHGLAALIQPPEVVKQALEVGAALRAYFERLIEARRASLGDDLLSGLIRAEAEGDRLSPEELISQAMGLLIAGFETTIGLIGNGARALILHPRELVKLRERPELIESAVEECLRWDPPIPLTSRFLHEDAEFDGHVIPKDTQVMAMLISANRDPERFPEPDRLDVERADNAHLSFGGGVHFCLGAHLARLEGRIALGTLVQRLSGLELVSPEVEWGASLFRVPGRLPIRFTPERR